MVCPGACASGGDSNFGPVIELDERRRALIVEGDRLRTRNRPRKGDEVVPKPSPEFDEFRARMKGIAESIKKISDEQNDVDAQQRFAFVGAKCPL